MRNARTHIEDEKPKFTDYEIEVKVRTVENPIDAFSRLLSGRLFVTVQVELMVKGSLISESEVIIIIYVRGSQNKVL